MMHIYYLRLELRTLMPPREGLVHVEGWPEPRYNEAEKMWFRGMAVYDRELDPKEVAAYGLVAEMREPV